MLAAPARATGLTVAIFSKHLQFLTGEQLATTAAELGFDGVDLTVRAGGHVEPARVAQDLPPLVSLIRAHGLAAPMITTDIVDAGTPYVADILRVMASLGIPRYRWGGFRYIDAMPLAKQLEPIRPRIAHLAELNRQYGVGAMYHTHSGRNQVGASIWDLHELLNGLDPALVGVNYDVGHATVEGGLGGWINSFRITGGYLRGIAVKDFLWARDEDGAWSPHWKPLGQGMVRFPEFFEMVRAAGFSGPVQLHFEYPLGGANDGARTLTVPRDEVFSAMKRDLRQLRRWLA
ncbi:MAG TPA: sugar phosphate isomerase/epimerase family protein [Bryobacteraceae bacterium]|nr:sugar phosphate isomerase/epimerase family protein [Bryobacteraceae bacterium]